MACPFCEGHQKEILKKGGAFLTYSLAPYHPDHLLIVPSRHVEYLHEISDEEMRDIDALQKEGIKILNKLGHTNISVLVREGENIGKTIAHLHYHIIPDSILELKDHAGDERIILSPEQISALTQRLQKAFDEVSLK